MKGIIWIAAIFCGLVACSTPSETKGEQPRLTEQVTVVAGPFEIAEAWIATHPQIGKIEAEVLANLREPVVERMHQKGDGRYVALVIDRAAGTTSEAILLHIDRETDSWRVASTEVVRADYLWPTQ